MTTINRYANESEDEFCERMFRNKFTQGLTWSEVAEIINNELNYNLSGDAYRKRSSRMYASKTSKYKEEVGSNQLAWNDAILLKMSNPTSDDEFQNYMLDESIKERIKIRDERTQLNSLMRRITREETLKEMVKESISFMDEHFPLSPAKPDKLQELHDSCSEGYREAVLQLSDIHYGAEIDNFWNQYNPQICKRRLQELRDKVIVNCKRNKVYRLYIVNLGDLISGRIHTQLRINSRLDVVTQTQHISELIAEFIADISTYIPEVEYYDCLDNHSRIEPIKENSLNLESLSRFTAWYLKERLKYFKNVTILDENKYSPDIISFDTLGHKIIGVHGDKDKPSQVVQNLSLMTQDHYDLVLTSHKHHFSADEVNQTLLLSNGSIMGTDEYAEKLRLSANPSQNLIIVSEDNVMEVLYRIVLN